MQEQIKKLMAEKDALQHKIAEIDEQIRAIDSVKSFEKGVVDSEGFPRADIDFGQLAQYKSLKRQKAELNNDHLRIMKEIEKQLFALHATLPDIPESQQQVHENPRNMIKKPKEEVIKPQQKKEQKNKQYVIDYLTPFAKISLVECESPAEKGGLKTGDLLSEFSEVNIYTIDSIKQIPKYVKEGLDVPVIVMRKVSPNSSGEMIFQLKDGNKYEKIKCSLRPMRWAGKGLLGCKIDPL